MAGREHDRMPASGKQLAERATLTAGTNGRDLERGDILGLRARRSPTGEHRERDGPAAGRHNTPAREPRSCKTGHENSSPICRCPMMAHGGASPRPPELPQLMDKSQSTNLVVLTRTGPALRQQRPVLTCASADFYNSCPRGESFCTLSAARLRDGSLALPWP